MFLGTLTANHLDANSVWNPFGAYGSEFTADSIWNSFGAYGSSFSSESPWNNFATDPPVIVDRQGNFYGYFTIGADNWAKLEESLD